MSVLSIVPALAALGDAVARAAFEAGKPFVIVIDDVPIRVAYTRGTSPTVFLATPYAPRASARDATDYRSADAKSVTAARPLGITLVRETADDRTAKAKGVTREIQTGDADFDRDVFIDTRTEDDPVRAVLNPAVRAGVRTLLAGGFRRIEIDNDAGEIAASRGIAATPDNAAEIAGAFAAIAKAVPMIEQRGRWVTRTWAFLLLLSMVFALPVACITALLAGPTSEVLVGELAGGAAGYVIGALIGRTQHGHSNSHWRVRIVIAAAMGVLATAGAAIMLVRSNADTITYAWFIAVPLLVAASVAYALRRE